MAARDRIRNATETMVAFPGVRAGIYDIAHHAREEGMSSRRLEAHGTSYTLHYVRVLRLSAVVLVIVCRSVAAAPCIPGTFHPPTQ